VRYVGQLLRLLLVLTQVTIRVTLVGNIACKPPPDICEVTQNHVYILFQFKNTYNCV